MVEVVARLEEHFEGAVPRRRRGQQLERGAVLPATGERLGQRASGGRGERRLDAVEQELLPQRVWSQAAAVVDGDERQGGEAVAVDRSARRGCEGVGVGAAHGDEEEKRAAVCLLERRDHLLPHEPARLRPPEPGVQLGECGPAARVAHDGRCGAVVGGERVRLGRLERELHVGQLHHLALQNQATAGEIGKAPGGDGEVSVLGEIDE